MGVPKHLSEIEQLRVEILNLVLQLLNLSAICPAVSAV